MTRRPEDRRAQRILVALDASAESLAALHAAAGLAARMSAELVGLFVEDINLLRLARLPVALHVSLPSGAGEPLDSGILEDQLGALAARARRALDDAARATGVRGSFQVARGPVVAEVLAAAEEADLLILGGASRRLGGGARLGGTARAAARRARRPVLLLPRGARLAGPVRIVYDGERACERALDEGLRLARALDAALVVLAVADDAPAAHRLAARARDRLAEHDARAREEIVVGQAKLKAVLRAGQEGILVLAADSAALEGPARELPDEVGCPILLVR